MKKISATIVADSVGPSGDRITSMLVTFPRFILAELNTHRLFTKNSASSRAIPFNKMLESVSDDPFIPIAWQKDHTGMQGTEYFSEKDLVRPNDTEIKDDIPFHLTQVWLEARNEAIKMSSYASNLGLTKQLCNRLLEPFLWCTVLVTATEWDNFFDLRTPKYTIKVDANKTPYKSRKDLRKAVEGWWSTPSDWEQMTEADWLSMSQAGAEIHMQVLAEAMWDAMKASSPKTLAYGEWHIPFGDQIDPKALRTLACDYANKLEENSNSDSGCMVTYDFSAIELKLAVKIAIARCARLSYMTFDKEIDLKKDLELYDRLLANKHMSPFEHCARAMSITESNRFIKGEILTMRVPNSIKHPSIEGIWVYPNSLGWCNNFKGFIQHRYMLESSHLY